MKGKRKKLTALFLCVVFIAALTACAGKNEEAAYELSLSGENKVDENTEETEEENSDTNILIAYFTWAVFSFIEEYDFSGKTIIPFCAHGTGGLAGSVKDITDALPDSAKVLEPIGVYRPDVDSAQLAINEWLDSLGYTEGSTQSGDAGQLAADTSGEDSRQVSFFVDGQECRLTLGNGAAADSLCASHAGKDVCVGGLKLTPQ